LLTIFSVQYFIHEPQSKLPEGNLSALGQKECDSGLPFTTLKNELKK